MPDMIITLAVVFMAICAGIKIFLKAFNATQRPHSRFWPWGLVVYRLAYCAASCGLLGTNSRPTK